MKKIIHVNQHIIKKNRKNGATEPVLTCKTYKTNQYAHEAVIYDTFGFEAARIIYSPNKPLSCGARVWIETHNEIELFTVNRQPVNPK